MSDEDIIETFSNLLKRIKTLYPDIAYISVIMPRVSGINDDPLNVGSDFSDEFLREIWGDKPYISSGGYTAESAQERSDRTGNLVAFGRMFTSNASLLFVGSLTCTLICLLCQPDLPTRIRKGIPFTKYNRAKFVGGGAEGYIDFPFADEAAVAR